MQRAFEIQAIYREQGDTMQGIQLKLSIHCNFDPNVYSGPLNDYMQRKRNNISSFAKRERHGIVVSFPLPVIYHVGEHACYIEPI